MLQQSSNSALSTAGRLSRGYLHLANLSRHLTEDRKDRLPHRCSRRYCLQSHACSGNIQITHWIYFVSFWHKACDQDKESKSQLISELLRHASIPVPWDQEVPFHLLELYGISKHIFCKIFMGVRMHSDLALPFITSSHSSFPCCT